MAQFHKDNHYVPQLYLKQWSREGKIFTYRLLVSNVNVPLWKEHSLRGVAFHRHLYTYVIGGQETDEFERWLGAEIESPAEEAIRLAVSGQRMTPENWKSLVRFAVAQDLRTPKNLRDFFKRQGAGLQETMSETLKSSVKKMEEAIAAGMTLPKRDINNADQFPFKVSIVREEDGQGGFIQAETIIGRRLWLSNVRYHLTSTIKKITSSYWTVVLAPSGITWPTSDNPVVKLNFHDEKNYDFGGGWGAPNCDIFMPLSPTHLLHNSVGRRSWPRGTVLNRGLAQLIRKIIIQHADRYIFDNTESDDVSEIRARQVNKDAYRREVEAWQNWHQEQSIAETDLFK